MATPDVRVRLSAEGVAEVVSAFKKVRDQADRTAKIGKKGFSGLNGSISATSGLLGQLSGVLAGIGFAAFVKQAGDAAETLSLIKERFGASAADISALDTALQGMQSSLADTEKAFGKILIKTGEAADGLRTAEQEFFALGLSAKEVKNFANQDFVQRIETIAAAAAKLPDGPQKTETLFRLLGAKGAVLIPLFRKMGKEGLEPLRREAERLGTILDEDILTNAAKINEGLDDIAAVGRGLSAQFAAGLGPGLKAGLEAVVDEIVSGKGAWRDFGEIAGKMIGFVIVLIATMADSVHTRLTTLAANAVSLFRGLKDAATGNFEDAQVHFESIGLRYERENALLAERVNRAWDRFFNPSDDDPLKRLLDSFGDDGEDAAKRFDRMARERAQVEKARIDGQLKAVQVGLALQEQAETENFERGLTDVKTYYAERRRIVEEGLEAEAKAIADKLAEVRKDTTIQGIAEQRALEAQLALIPQRKEKEIADLGSKERRDVEEIALKRLELDRKVFEARGDQHEAILRGIDEEVRKTAILLGQQGATDTDAILEDLRRRLTAQADFDEAAARGARELEALGRESAAISDRQAAGLIGQGTALEKIAEIEKDRLPRLREIAAQLRIEAQLTGNEARIAEAEAFTRQVDQLEVAVERTQFSMAKLKATGEDALAGGLEKLFTEGARDAENFGQAIAGMVAGVIDALRRMIAQFLAAKAATAVFSLFGGGGGGGGGAEVSGAVFAATGGLVSGPGGPTSDAVPAMLSDGEFVVRAKAVSSPGVLEELHRINRGARRVRPVDGTALRMASGGLVEASGGSDGVGDGSGLSGHLSATLGLEDGLVVRALDTPEGERWLVRTIAKNRRSLRRALG